MLPPRGREGLVETLVAARHSANLSIRRAATVAKVPPSTAQGWFEGRLPTPALMPHFLDLLAALGLAGTDEEREAWHRAVTAARSAPVVGESPYVGLRSYTARESERRVRGPRTAPTTRSSRRASAPTARGRSSWSATRAPASPRSWPLV